MVVFHREWYDNLIAHSNEKGLLVERISDLLKGKTHESCLEIGLGTSPYFSERLSRLFKEYWIIEKNKFSGPLPYNTKFIQGDFEDVSFDKKFDVIFASHVAYYFKDLSSSVKKIMQLLTVDGRAYFVVNGKESDYGPIKYAFAAFTKKRYKFTYDILKSELKDYSVKEYTTQASLSFSSYEDLYETLRLSFDLYPKEYEENKKKVIEWFKLNVVGDKFFIDQKIFEIKYNWHSKNQWFKDTLPILNKMESENQPYKMTMFGKKIVVLPKVCSPKYFSDSKWFAREIPRIVGKRSFLEIGAGTGVVALFVALGGSRHIIATDINPEAVKNAKKNFSMNRLNIPVRLGDMFAPVKKKERFDYIFWNHPFIDSPYKTDNILFRSSLDYQYEGIKSFFAGCRNHLNPDGQILLGTGNIARISEIKMLATEKGYSCKLLKKKILQIERGSKILMDIRIYSFTPKKLD